MTIASGQDALASDILKCHNVDGYLEFAPAAELTISSGVIVITQNYHRVDTEGNAASDDLDTINGGTEGFLLVLRAEDAARTIVVKDGTGNILLPGGDYHLNDGERIIALIFDGSNWRSLAAPPASGVPQGMIAVFDAACPDGWARVSAWDAKFLRGASTYGGTGGADSHTHDANHTHTATHEHAQNVGGAESSKAQGVGIIALGNFDEPWWQDGGVGGYTMYPVHTGAASSGSLNSAGGATSLADHLPPYIEVVFCKKD